MIKWFKRKKAKEAGVSEVESPDSPMDEAVDEPAGDLDQEPPDALMEEGGPGEPSEEGEDQASWEAEMEPDAEAVVEDRPEKKRWASRLRERLRKSRERLVHRLDGLMAGRKHLDEDMLDELEEILITSDLGVRTTQRLLQHVTEGIKRRELKDAEVLRQRLREDIRSLLSLEADPWDFEKHRPFVIMAVGVNGVGKTTTVGKLGHRLKQEGRSVMLVAADTFRAAAVEQLVLWGERTQVPVIHQKSGSDPSAVAFDAIDAAVARGVDVVLLDTAGRMHTKANLMEELKKIQRVIARKLPGAPHEVLLVLDATTGQNALSQARQFKEGVGVTGLILTKLDGTAKGGIVTAICEETGVPVRFIGIGEAVEDLRPFDPDEFSRALF
ncbi:MAG: signal recognition particle-docking protein FtsY [Syntrophobacteraceae bacterium]|jgi:fused signal recognition particle receptor|nr:signal recognition particle-docking protein FtsY [Syntrophobacteraceae bacterium]